MTQSGRLDNKTRCRLQETNFRVKDIHRLKVREWKKVFHANRNDKKAGVTILISSKIDFKTKPIKKDKKGHCVLIKGSIQGDSTLTNIYAPNIAVPKTNASKKKEKLMGIY